MTAALKVSCLIVTRDDPTRLHLLKRRVGDFQRQTYAAREVIVLAEATDVAGFTRVRQAVESVQGDAPVRVVEVSLGSPLGALRNRSTDEASGDLFCRWDDDDDPHHPRRFAVQVAGLEIGKYDANFLRQIVRSFDRDRVAYIGSGAPTAFAGHLGTPVVRRRATPRYPEEGAVARRGQDSILHHELARRMPIGAVDSMPCLFACAHHGSNTWERKHHEQVAVQLSPAPARVATVEPELRRELTLLALTSASLEVRAQMRLAFTRPGAVER